jgi:hypothetical protein
MLDVQGDWHPLTILWTPHSTGACLKPGVLGAVGLPPNLTSAYLICWIPDAFPLWEVEGQRVACSLEALALAIFHMAVELARKAYKFLYCSPRRDCGIQIRTVGSTSTCLSQLPLHFSTHS